MCSVIVSEEVAHVLLFCVSVNIHVVVSQSVKRRDLLLSANYYHLKMICKWLLNINYYCVFCSYFNWWFVDTSHFVYKL